MPALFLDCSSVWRDPSRNSGVHRVVRRVGGGLLQRSQAQSSAHRVLPVAWDSHGECRRLEHIPSPGDRPHLRAMEVIRPEPGDCYLAIGAAWEREPLMRLSPWWLAGLVVGLVQYDVVPLEYPGSCPPDTVRGCERWFAQAATFADFYACVSQTTLAGVRRQLRLRHAWRTLDADSAFTFRLGADFLDIGGAQTQSPSLASIFEPDGHVFLSVGALNPRRKNQALILDAFEMLWERGSPAQLLLIGPKGSFAEGLVRRLRRHAEWGRRLHWRESVSDSDLDFAYAHASGLIAASVDEGASLPLVEASRRGAPLFASDIPAFRETVGDGARYFHRRNPAALVALLEDAAGTPTGAAGPSRVAVPTVSWQESTDEMVEGLARVATVKSALRGRVRRTARTLADARRLLR